MIPISPYIENKAMSTNARFYQDLPSVARITAITDPTIYHEMPDDWLIAITDVQGSTKAIESGKYKEVNGIAAATICALLNHMPEDIDIPFVFGGDGATIVIPPTVEIQARESLIATQRLAREQFSLTLRIGIVPIADVRAGGYRVRVAKLKYSDNFYQAVFTGGGLAYADKLIKAPDTAHHYATRDNPSTPYEADFSGYECRWNEIPSQYDETVSLLVQAMGGSEASNQRIYGEVLNKLELIYGDEVTRNPLAVAQMRPSFNPSAYSVETRIRDRDNGLKTRLKLMAWSIGGWLLWHYKEKIWARYKQVVVEATDREKFDDMLRMIIAGTVLQREALTAYLEAKRQQGELVYGVHTSRHALMTCLVFDRFGKQVHFVDGANGGYALAARQLKSQLA